MHTDLFALLCDELGYEPSTVLTIRISQDRATVTYTEPSGMPRGRVHPLDRDVDQAAV
jgi:hypothetical protein